MIFVATVHHRSEGWIAIQRSYLARHVAEPFQIWANLEGVDHRADAFDRVIAAVGPHAGKLNLIAAEISAVASPDDLLMFLDGDAFPIADPMPLVRDALSTSDFVAVRRLENTNDPQPHPCFAVTSVRTWMSIGGDWSAGHPWPYGSTLTSDVGGNLLRLLELHDKTWHALRRSNRTNLHPLWYGIYGGIVYHHGAGFRDALSRWDMQAEPRMVLGRLSRHRRIGRPARAFNYARRKRWERRVTKKHLKESNRIYEEIKADHDFYRRFL